MGFGDVEDDYDPARPNDYMEYCRERINKKKKEERDRELKIIMEEQEREVRTASLHGWHSDGTPCAERYGDRLPLFFPRV